MRISAETLAPVSEWLPGIRSLFPTIFLNHLPQEIQILHPFELSGLLSHLVFQEISDASKFCNSSVSAIRISPFQIRPRSMHIQENPWQYFLTKLMNSCLISCGYWKVFHQCTKWYDRSLRNDSPNLLSCGVFPSFRRSWTLRRYAIAFYGI